MNKQIMGFLSLFSLVLVLSIYYVVSPSFNKVDKVNKQNDITTNVETSSYKFLDFASNRDANHKEVINEQVEIISNISSTSQEIITARNKISLEESYMKAEKELEEILTAIPFSSTYVEIQEDEFIMKAYNKDLDKNKEIEYVISIFDASDKYVKDNKISFINLDLAQVEIVY